MFGLFFFIVGYARFRNDLSIGKEGLAFDSEALRKRERTLWLHWQAMNDIGGSGLL